MEERVRRSDQGSEDARPVMSEAGLWNYIRDHVPGPDWVRVENSVGPGTPDVNYSYDGSEGWIELKWVAQFPKSPRVCVFGNRRGLRPAQKVWIRRRTLKKGSVWIVAGVGRHVFFIPGDCAFAFNRFRRSDLENHSALSIARGDPTFGDRVLELLRYGPPSRNARRRASPEPRATDPGNELPSRERIPPRPRTRPHSALA